MKDVVSTSPARTVLLGPQRDYHDVVDALDELGVDGPIALITAGWQENESEDDALSAALGRPTVNLALHARSEAIYAQDPDFRTAWVGRQKQLIHLQDFYRMRLEAIDEADHAIAVRHVETDLLDAEMRVTAGQLQHLDAAHLTRMADVHAAFDTAWRPAQRAAIRQQRKEVALQLGDCAAVVISGGHVMSLLNRLRLLDAFESLGNRPVVAWSAGAMVLTERIVLFHDTPPFGKNLAQVVDAGLGRCPGVVVLPDAAHRIDAAAARGLQRFSRRMQPATCWTLDAGERLAWEDGALVATQSRRMSRRGCLVAAEVV